MKEIYYWSIPGLKRKERVLQIGEVAEAVADFNNITVEELKTGVERRVSVMRYVVMYLMEKWGDINQKEQADYFGYASRCVVTVGCNRIRQVIDWDGEVRDTVEWVEYRLFGGSGWSERDNGKR